MKYAIILGKNNVALSKFSESKIDSDYIAGRFETNERNVLVHMVQAISDYGSDITKWYWITVDDQIVLCGSPCPSDVEDLERGVSI